MEPARARTLQFEGRGATVFAVAPFVTLAASPL